MTPNIVVVDGDKPNGICESLWGRNKCPNQAEFIIKNTTNIGFAVMCGPHKDGFTASYPYDDIEVMPYSDETAMGYWQAVVDSKIKAMEDTV